MSVEAAELMSVRVDAPAPDTCSSRGGWLLPGAAGVLAGAAVFDLLPAAVAGAGPSRLAWVPAGVLAMALVGGRKASRSGTRLAWAGAAGIWMHSLLEGMIAASGFQLGTAAGVLVAATLVMHILPEAGVLSAFGSRPGTIDPAMAMRILVTFAMVGLGFTLANTVFSGVGPGDLGAALAAAAGSMGYLALATLGRSSAPALVKVAGMGLGAAWIALLHLPL